VAQDQKIEFLFAAQVSGNEQLKNLTQSVDKLRQEMDALKAANGGLVTGMGNFSRSIGNASAHVQAYQKHLDAQAKAMRNHRQGTQQAGMQINDFVTSVSTGASPIQAFNQQIGQVGYAMSMMGGKMGAVGAFLAGPWSIAVIGASMLIGALVEGLFETDEASNKAKNATIDLADSFDFASASSETLAKLNEALAGANKQVAATAIQAANATAQKAAADANAAQQSLNLARAELTKRKAILATMKTPTAFAGGGVAGAALTAGQFATNKQNQAIEEQMGVVDGLEKSVAGLQFRNRKFTAESYSLSAAMDANGKIIEKHNARIANLKNNYAAGKITQAQLTKGLDAENAAIRRLEDTKSRTGGRGSSRSAGNSSADRAKKEKPDFSLLGFYEEFFAKEFQQNDESLATLAEGQIKSLLETVPDMAKMSDEMAQIISRNEELNNSFDAIGNSVSDSFKGMLTGAMSFKDAMKGIIGAVIDELWKLFVVQQIVGVVKSAMGSVFGVKVPGKAIGGSVGKNKPYMVGEQGPELFIPGGSGTIIPNRNLSSGSGGGPINISVDARGASDPAAVRAQVQQGIMEAAPAIIAAAESRTVAGLRRPRLGGVMQ